MEKCCNHYCNVCLTFPLRNDHPDPLAIIDIQHIPHNCAQGADEIRCSRGLIQELEAIAGARRVKVAGQGAVKKAGKEVNVSTSIW